jgi:hypothetical protein
MKECEQLKRALGVPLSTPRVLGATTTMTGMVANVSTTIIVDLIDEIIVIAGRIHTTVTGTDVIITMTTAAMIDATTTVAMTAMTGVTTAGVIVVMIATTTSAMTDEMTDVMIDAASTTTITTTTTGRNELHRHRPKGATPMARFRRPTARSTVHPLTSSLTLDFLDEHRLDCLYLYINITLKGFPSTRLVLG